MKQQNLIGKRLSEIRNIWNGGFRATIEQFATELGEQRHNISNYESGKANIPPRVLVALFEKGYNPVYILTGTGDVYADNEKGRSLKLAANGIKADPVIPLQLEGRGKMSIDELSRKASEYIAAAGDILKLIEEKRNS